MPNRLRISTSQRSTEVVGETHYDIRGLPAMPVVSGVVAEAPVDPRLLAAGGGAERSSVGLRLRVSPWGGLPRPELEEQRAAAVRTLNGEDIENTQQKVIAMEKM